MKFRFRLLAILLFASSTLYSQNVTRNGSMYWIKYQNKIQLPKQWSIQTEFESRRFISPERSFHLVVPRVHLHKKIENLDLGVGFAYFLLSTPADPSSDVEVLVPELRPHVDFGFTFKPLNVSLQNRYRLEGRFIHKNDAINLTDGYSFWLRFRYRLGTTLPLTKSQDNRFFLIIADEILLNAGGGSGVPIYDHNRVTIGPRFKLSSLLNIDMVYMHWYQQLGINKNFASYHIVSLTLHHLISPSR